MAKQLTGLIEVTSKTYLKKDIKINHNELIPLFDNYTDTLNYSIDILKNVSLIFLTIYVKKYSASVYYTMLKYIYNYQTGIELESFNERMAKIKLTSIIEEKRWNELLDPNVYKAIIHLYQLNTDNTNIFNDLVHNFYYSLGKMFAVWTISSFFKQVLFGPIISVFMVLYRRNQNGNILWKLGLILVSGIIGYFTQNFFLTSFICQFGYQLLFNRVVKTIVTYVGNESVKKFNQLNTINSDYIVPTITTTVFMMILGFIFNSTMVLIMLLEAMRNIISNRDYKRTGIYCILLVSGFLSTFHPLHILHNAIIVYIMMGLIDVDTSNMMVYETKLLLGRWYIELVNEKRMLADGCKDGFNRLIKIIGNRFKRTPNYQQIRFEMLDTDLFPSVSQKIGCKSDTDKNDIGNPLNDQQIVKRIRPNSIEISAKLFMLDEDDFVEAISVGSKEQFTKVEESILIESIVEANSEHESDQEFDTKTEIIEDFCKSR